jgi:hypothetical protein
VQVGAIDVEVHSHNLVAGPMLCHKH